MDSNFWFYTLSAIPQTLGAIIALTATFIIFKLSKINDSIDSHCYHIKIILRAIYAKKDIPRSDNPYDFLELFNNKTAVIKSDDEEWWRQRKDNLSRAYEQIVRDPTGASLEDLKDWLNYQIRDDFSKKISNKKSILSYLRQTLALTVFTIILCLLFLPLCDFSIGAFSPVVIGISVGLAGGSVMATAISIFRIIKL